MGNRWKNETLEERFWSHVAKSSGEECWLWTGCRNGRGYGAISVKCHGNRKTEKASRVAYALSNGMTLEELSDSKLFVLHKCDNPPCCNPGHLFLGTHADNMKDMIGKGRYSTSKREASRPRGDNHHSRKNPNCMARGDRSGARTKPHRVPRGERAGMAKLTDELVLVCRLAHFRYGLTQRHLARRWGVSGIAMHNAINGKTYSHLKGY